MTLSCDHSLMAVSSLRNMPSHRNREPAKYQVVELPQFGEIFGFVVGYDSVGVAVKRLSFRREY